MLELTRNDWVILGLSASAAAISVMLLTGLFRYCLAWLYSKIEARNIAYEWRGLNAPDS